MSLLFWATIVLFAATLIFYIVFTSLIYYWHEKRATYVVLPVLYTFEFFIIGFFAMALVVLFFQYLPEVLKLLNLS